jgi:hypothetical protein
MPNETAAKEATMDKPHSRRVLVTAFGLAALFLGCVAQAQSMSPTVDINGRIVFRRYLDVGKTGGAIFTVNPNGKRVVRVTHAGRT